MTSRKKKLKPHHESSSTGSANALFCSVMLTCCPAHKSPASRGERVSLSCFHVKNDDMVRILLRRKLFWAERDLVLPVSPWLIALWSFNKTQALGRACLFPSMPSLALSFSLPMQADLTTGPERGTAPWTFCFFLLPYLGLACMTSEHLHLVSESKWVAQGGC